MAGNLKITDVERIVVAVPFTPRCEIWNAREVYQWRITEIIRLSTDSPGIVGFGETIIHYTFGCVSDEAIERVMGGNPADFLGDDSLGAGLQMAMYDVVGKALGVPTYRLFNLPSVREWCPISWWNIDFPPEEFAAEAKEALEHGYTSYKIKARPWWDVYEQVKAISNVTPHYFELDLDWNQMLLNAGNATPVLTDLDEFERIAIYESPIMQHDIEGHHQLRQKIKHPIALHFGNPPFPSTVRDEVCDGFVIGGGVERVLREGQLSEAFEKPFWLQLVGTGLTTTLSLHLGAVLKFAQWPAVNCLNNYADDLLVEPLTIQGGYARVPDGPGLGIEIDEESLIRYKMEPPYKLQVPRQILSVVWSSGHVRHYKDMTQCRNDALTGNVPAQEHGVKMDVKPDDGSKDWVELYARTEIGPVIDQL